jgi:hypothetical protein
MTPHAESTWTPGLAPGETEPQWFRVLELVQGSPEDPVAHANLEAVTAPIGRP